MPDERHYASRINEVYDGHYSIANPDLKEYKEAPHFWQPLSELIIGCSAKFIGLKIESLLVLSDFIFPFILFLIIYTLAYHLIGSRTLALLCTCAMMMVNIFIFGPPQALIYWVLRFSNLDLAPVLNPKSSFLFSRTVNPQFNLIPFFLSLISIYGVVFRESKKYVVFSGILIGSFFYCNFYYWSYVIGGCGLFSLYSLLKKDYKTVWKFIFSVLIGGLISLPYWVSAHELRSAPFFEEALNRTYMVYTHALYLPKIEILAIAFFLIFYPQKDRPYIFISSFLLAGLVCENSQVLTGMKMAPYHWTIYCQAPVLWLAYVLMVNNIGKRWPGNKYIILIKQKKNVLASLLIFLAFFNAVHTQIIYTYATDREKGPRAFYEKSLPTWLGYQKLYPALDWLNKEGEKDSVVLASVWTSYLITSFTHCNILVGWHTHTYLISDQELLERWLIKSYFFGVPVEKVYDVIEPNLDGICEICPWRWKEEERPAFRLRLEETYRKLREESIQTWLAKYDVEYILFSQAEREDYYTGETGFDISEYPFLDPITVLPEVELYKVRLP